MPQADRFIGQGITHQEPWSRSEDGDEVANVTARDHPAYYEADPGLVAAVNTAMLLEKPLLLTGNPGTGKSELAERIAWELKLGPVLRFEAQSLSEVGDLFYRFDLVGRMAEARLADIRGAVLNKRTSERVMPVADSTHPAHFVEIAPLGKAILRAGARPDDPDDYKHALFEAMYARLPDSIRGEPSQSVVLIDEIDKASRDFPNDLLNGIARMEFRIHELDNLLVKVPRDGDSLKPVVIITSNLERDLPDPFLRRCVFYHIPDPSPERMAHIVNLRVFPADHPDDTLPPFYQDLLDFFVQYRADHDHVYTPGTSEMIDAMTALKRRSIDADGTVGQQRDAVRQVLCSIAKHRDDIEHLTAALERWSPA